MSCSISGLNVNDYKDIVIDYSRIFFKKKVH